MSGLGTFLKELRRRRVFRTTGLYIIGAWVVLQFAEVTLQAWGFPGQALRYVYIAALLCFPLAILFGWMYDVTSDGIVRTRGAKPGQPVDLRLQRSDYLILASLVVIAGAVVYGLAQRIVESEAVEETALSVAEQRVEDVSPQSVAVLPFKDISAADADAAFLAHGIHSDLLTLLSNVHDIKIISRTSVERYRRSGKSIPEIARELGVATVMEGDVQRAENQVRIHIQLIEASTDESLWAESFDRELTAANVFGIQREIAESVVDALKATLTQEEQAQLGVLPTENLDAYTAYSLGRQRLSKRIVSELEEAARYFSRAIALDPNYSLAYVGVNDACLLLAVYGGGSTSEHCASVESLLDKALQLDPNSGQAHTVLGWNLWRKGDLEGAERAFRRAIELSPNYPTAYQWYGSMLSWDKGLPERALEMHLKALELDPLSLIVLINVGIDYADLGEFEKAMQHVRKTIEIEPQFAQGYESIGGLYNAALGQPEEAFGWISKAVALNPKYYWPRAHLGMIYLDLGEFALAESHINKGLELAPEAPAAVCGSMLANIYASDEIEAASAARECLERASRVSGTWIAYWRALALAVLRDADIGARRFDDALARYEENFPELFSEQYLPIDRTNFRAAVDLALVLQHVGQHDRAELLLNRSLQFIKAIPRMWVSGYQVKDAEIFALQGRHDEALAALQQAIDQGWRRFWWYIAEHESNLATTRDRPEFQAMMAQMRADMAVRLVRVRPEQDH